ncbi:sigma-70 family RNA polymerase sigma factor [Paracoccus siganidrum]|nr:sigma-70 family RNA polymerase sigma factor [Paracoccus siganidrum]
MTRHDSAPAEGKAALSHVLQELIANRNLFLCEAARILGAPDQAEDVLQEAALRCMSRKEGHPRIERPRHFAWRMIRNLAIDRLRRDRPLVTGERIDPATSESDPEICVAGRQALRQLNALLDTCPRRDKEVFLRHRVRGEAQNRLAEQFGLSPARVNAIIARTHALLSEEFPDALAG